MGSSQLYIPLSTELQRFYPEATHDYVDYEYNTDDTTEPKDVVWNEARKIFNRVHAENNNMIVIGYNFGGNVAMALSDLFRRSDIPVKTIVIDTHIEGEIPLFSWDPEDGKESIREKTLDIINDYYATYYTQEYRDELLALSHKLFLAAEAFDHKIQTRGNVLYIACIDNNSSFNRVYSSQIIVTKTLPTNHDQIFAGHNIPIVAEFIHKYI